MCPKLGHSSLRRDASYLITGGTGGVGQALTKWLVRQGVMNIILTSRSGLDNQDVRDLVQELEVLGAKIAVLKCDISNRSSVERLAEECSRLMPPVKGVIHGSAVFQVSKPSPPHTIPSTKPRPERLVRKVNPRRIHQSDRAQG